MKCFMIDLLSSVIINMKKEPPQEINLNLEFDDVKVLFCNFNGNGELVLFCMGKNSRGDKIKMVCVHSIQADRSKTKCQKIYMIQNETKLISISKDDRIWLRLHDDIYEWNLHNGHTTIMSKNISGVNLSSIFNHRFLKFI